MRKYDDELEMDEVSKQNITMQEYIRYGIIAVIVLVAIVLLIVLLRPQNESDVLGTEISMQTEQQSVLQTDTESETEVLESSESVTETEEQVALLTAGTVLQNSQETYGIDVAKYQGIIDWEEVAAQEIDFVMVRVGYRSTESGEIHEDEMAKYNLQEASKYGIKLGAYFFSTAITEEEALEEADWVVEFIEKYPITYPVAYDCEGYDKEKNRHFCLTKEERTNLAITFMDRIYEHGYTPMFYGAKSELTDELMWETSRLEKRYRVWVSQYSSAESTDYVGQYVMWQCTNQGSIPGVEGNVDLNIAYFGYESTEAPHSNILPEQVAADVEVLMNFEEVEEYVTAKNKTNLRDIPSQGEDSTVMAQLIHGETAVRTGISNSGWSRVEYNGNVYYAVSSYLTTDLEAPAQQDTPIADDGIKTEFTECNEIVTAKIEVNLRSLPSVTNVESQVIATLYNGENVTRTGVNTDYGWSRVEYNGQTLYCVSSYLQVVQ